MGRTCDLSLELGTLLSNPLQFSFDRSSNPVISYHDGMDIPIFIVTGLLGAVGNTNFTCGISFAKCCSSDVDEYLCSNKETKRNDAANRRKAEEKIRNGTFQPQNRRHKIILFFVAYLGNIDKSFRTITQSMCNDYQSTLIRFFFRCYRNGTIISNGGGRHTSFRSGSRRRTSW